MLLDVRCFIQQHLTMPYHTHGSAHEQALVHGQLQQFRALPAPPHHRPGRKYTVETAQYLVLSDSLHRSRDLIPIISPPQSLLVRDLFIKPGLLSPDSDLPALGFTCKGTIFHTFRLLDSMRCC